MPDKIPIKIAYSPDTDDAFMMWALRENLINWGPFAFSFCTADIEVLNQKAKDGEYDITAISVANYPLIADLYIMMPIGGSVARGLGPAIIVNESSPIQFIADLDGKRIAVPGLHTSAALAARVVLPKFTSVPISFDGIAAAVASGDVAAGVLIHELQLNPGEQGFRVLGHLGDLWTEKFNLPLPLGTNAIRRNLGPAVINGIVTLMRQSVEFALAHRDQAIEFARHKAMTLTSANEADQYITQFVNQDSLTVQRDLKLAIEQMFVEGKRQKLWQSTPREPHFCP